VQLLDPRVDPLRGNPELRRKGLNLG